MPHLLLISKRRNAGYKLGGRVLAVLDILGSISVSLRCLTGNPHAKTDPQGLFSVVEGRVPQSIFRPFNLAKSTTAGDQVSNCFPAAFTILPCQCYHSFPRETTRQSRRSHRPHSAMRVRVKTRWSRLTSPSFPPSRFLKRVRFILRFI